MPKKSWILDALPNGVTHYNYTRIEAFSALVIVEYQLFTISFFIKTMPKKNHGFLTPYPLGETCTINIHNLG